MQEEIFKRYGKYIAFAIFTFGGSALTLYSRFQMTEIEIDNIEEKLNYDIEMIKDHEKRLRSIECNK